MPVKELDERLIECQGCTRHRTNGSPTGTVL